MHNKKCNSVYFDKYEKLTELFETFEMIQQSIE